MQRFISKYVARRQSSLSYTLASLRSFSAVCGTVEKDAFESQVLVQGMSKARASILNRPSSLNALTTAMGARLTRLYESWEDNPDIGFVAMKGSGRAFCAGGDVTALVRLLNEGKEEECKNFFRTLYRFIYIVGTYLKPHVAILDGITMGGGGGVSIPGTFRVTTDRTVFATPETQIGFHPDAGASFYLSRLPGYLGEYLALTGEKLDGPDMIACGLATHFCLNARLDMLDDRLSKLITDDPSVLESDLDTYCDLVYPEKKSVVRRMEIIDKCFSHDTVEEIIDALENEAGKSYDAKIDSALKKLKQASPLSLKVSLKSIRDGRFQSLDQCLMREYRMSLHGISKKISNDFCEGVRAQLLDKDYTPKWDPPTLDQVPKDMVESYFAPLGAFEPELELPIEQREPFL